MLFLLIITFILVYITFLWIKKTSRINKLTAGMAHPRRLPILGSSLEFGTKSDEMLENVIRIVSECGPEPVAVWQGPELFVILSSPEDIEVVLASNKLINKSFVYDFLHPWLGVSLLTGTGEKWRKSRKMITPAFHFKILEQFTDVFNSNSTVLIKKLKNELGKPGFNVVNYINLCTLDIISESSMGIEVNAQSDHKSPFVQAIHQLSFAILYRSFKPWLYPEFCFRLSKTGQTFYKNLEVVHNFVQKVIKSKREIRAQKGPSAPINEDFELTGTKKRAAFLDLLLDYSEAGAGLTDDNIASEVNTFMFAGHDTTTSAISFTLYALMKNPEVQEKVVNELKEIFRDSDRLPDYNDLQSMKYLDKVIKESLRMYPPVPYVGRSASEDFTLKSGQIIPKGVSLIILIYQLHYDPKLYPDPEKFIPERYDSETMHNVQTKYPYAFCPFSAGPRNCIGQKFSVLEMKSVISTILRNFKLLPPIGLPDINLAAELILRSSTGINMRIVNR